MFISVEAQKWYIGLYISRIGLDLKAWIPYDDARNQLL